MAAAQDDFLTAPTYRRLSDPRELAALAHPVRIAIMELLTVSGPLTATDFLVVAATLLVGFGLDSIVEAHRYLESNQPAAASAASARGGSPRSV